VRLNMKVCVEMYHSIILGYHHVDVREEEEMDMEVGYHSLLN